MTTLSRALTERANEYKSLSNFYRADGRRRSSRERDFGLWWRVGAHGPTYRAAWVRDTGELYVTRLGELDHGQGEVVVLGRARDRRQLEEALDGWQQVCAQPDSMTWLRHRAARLEPSEKPARALARGPVTQPHGVQGGRILRPRRGEVLSPLGGISAR
ncbi:MAG TPA: hypothetical protein VG010_02465 [Solirubrobacteraceae bacterium]|jgi:hypothetical protein|nr:hypothetical protein [Solirubrobacteraceae bacterium]